LVSNCFIWALWQFFRKGGYIVFRQANPPWPKWAPHVLWSPDLHEFWEFGTPLGEERPRFPLFRGVVKQTRPLSDKWVEGFAAGVKYAVDKKR
jgi:hypothetical protein